MSSKLCQSGRRQQGKPRKTQRIPLLHTTATEDDVIIYPGGEKAGLSNKTPSRQRSPGHGDRIPQT